MPCERQELGKSVHCLNCGEPLEGKYCRRCGQRERGRDVRISDLAGEALEDLSHLDSRLWRTLAGLLIRPGSVTAEYIAGRRAHFVPPVRLYLIVSFLVFLVVSGTPIETGVVGGGEEQLQSELQQKGIIVTLDGEDEGLGIEEIMAQESVEASLDLPGWLQPYEDRIRENAEAMEDDPTAFLALLVQRLPQMMFLLLPLFAFILWMAYLFSPFHYLQHLIFSLHFHTFAFLLFLLQWLLSLLRPGDYAGWVFLALLVYLPLGLMRVYKSGTGAAIGKSLFINFSYFLVVMTAGVIYVLLNLALL